MKTWIGLYAMTWIVLVEFLLAMAPSRPSWLVLVHGALGVGILALGWSNYARVRASRVPGRVKRTVQSTAQLTVVMALLGVLMYFRVGEPLALFGVTLLGVLGLAHAIVGFAIITQAAATGIAFDMWEEKEFLEESEPGVVPPMPQAERARAPRSAKPHR